MNDILDLVRRRLADGRAISDGDVCQMADEIDRLRGALAAQSMGCTCHEAYSGRRMQDPECRAGEYGDVCRAAIGLSPLCQYNIALEDDGDG